MLTELALVVGALAAIGYALYKYFVIPPAIWLEQGVPIVNQGKIASFFSRITMRTPFWDFDKGVYAQLKDQGHQYGGYYEFRDPVFYALDLDLARSILVKDFDHFADRRTFDLNKSDPIMARMMTQLQGKEWKDLRSMMTPTFTTGRLKRMFEFFNACGHHLVDYLKDKLESQNASGEGEPDVIDFQDTFSRYTMDAISSIAFGLDTSPFKEKQSKFQKMARQFQSFSTARFFKFILLILFPKIVKYFGMRISEQESIDFFADVIEQSIKYRRSEAGAKDKRQDFLQMMLEAQSGQLKTEDQDLVDNYEKDAVLKPSGKKESAVVLDDLTIVSQSILFLVAGADTIESLLTITAYVLAVYPEIQEKLAEEVTEVMDNNNGQLDYETTHGMVYLEKFVSETLRYYPPAILTERVCTQDYIVPGTKIKIPKGARALIPIRNIQHDERYYPNPDKFDPENFSAENKAKRHPYAYLPFGQGPRNCIAMRFALTETKAAVAHLVYNFRLEPCAKTDIPIKFGTKQGIMKPENGMPLRFIPRR